MKLFQENKYEREIIPNYEFEHIQVDVCRLSNCNTECLRCVRQLCAISETLPAVQNWKSPTCIHPSGDRVQEVKVKVPNSLWVSLSR